MTYLEFMMKCLKFIEYKKEVFDGSDFSLYWIGNVDKDIELYYKFKVSKIKKAIMYLLLSELQKSNNKLPLLELLEKDLSYSEISLCAIIEGLKTNAISLINDNPDILEKIRLFEEGNLTDEEQEEVLIDLFDELKKQIPNFCNTELYESAFQLYESAIHTIMEMVSKIIPELYFTEDGYKYIDKEYQIEDIELREKCYNYFKENIEYYNSERIYKVDEKVYSTLYEEELDDFDDIEYDESCWDNDDEIRGQVDIYGQDKDNYDILNYSITLLIVMLRFIKNKQYDKLTRLIELDEEMTNYFDGYRCYYDKTLIEALYQPKTMGQDYNKEITIPSKSDVCLEFFLSKNDFTQQYNTQQLSLIIAYCFDLFTSSPLKKIIKNIDMINKVFSTTDLNNKEENIKKLVKIRKMND